MHDLESECYHTEHLKICGKC